ncbi:TonB-dependent receptor [soil metagenome]
MPKYSCVAGMPAFAALSLLLFAVGSTQAQARAEPQREAQLSLRIPAQPRGDGLLDLALQARLSIGGDLRACSGRGPALVGSLSLQSALDRLLSGSGCDAFIERDGSVTVRRARPPAPSRPARPVAAVNAATDVVSQVADIVVTANRRPEFPQRAPSALSALSGRQLESARVEDITDLTSLTAGMTVTNLGPGRNKIFLRGMSDGAFTGLTQSTVALYLDFVPITYNAPDPDLKLLDIDRIEILRGPQGTLYGTGPIGGVVRVVPRRPVFDASTWDLLTTQSMTRSGGVNSDYAATANLPLFGGRLAARASVYTETFSGYIDDTLLQLSDVNRGSRNGVRLAIAARIAPDWLVTGGLVHQSINTDDTHYGTRAQGPLKRANRVREPHDNDFDEAYVTLEGQGRWGRVVASLAQVAHQYDSRYDATPALPIFGATGTAGALDESKSVDLLVGELTLASPPSSRMRWLAGGFFSNSSTTGSTVLSTLRPDAFSAYAEDRTDTLSEVAVFGELSWDLTDRLTATAGVRWFGFDYDVDSTVIQGANRRVFAGSDTASGLSPKLSLGYRINETVNTYVQLSQGYRAGGFNTAGPIGQGFTGSSGDPAREYLPDELWNLEAGAKAILWNGRISARAAAFRSIWSDIQSDQFLPSGLAYAVTVGDGSNQGIELEANWKVSDKLEVRINGVLDDPQITSPSTNFDSKGDSGLPGVPGFSANLSATWREPLSNGLSATANGSLAYVGRSSLTFDAPERLRMGDYLTGTFSIGLDGDTWGLSAFVDNPLDSRANTFSFGDPFRLAEGGAVTPLRPRTIGFSLHLRR